MAGAGGDGGGAGGTGARTGYPYHRSHFYGGGGGEGGAAEGGVEGDGSYRGPVVLNATHNAVDATGSGRTRELTFIYTVEPGHGTAALKYTSGAGALAGTITSLHTTAAANLALPRMTGGAGLPVYLDPIRPLRNRAYSSFVVAVDTERPRVVAVRYFGETCCGVYGVGDSVGVLVQFSHPVAVTVELNATAGT